MNKTRPGIQTMCSNIVKCGIHGQITTKITRRVGHLSRDTGLPQSLDTGTDGQRTKISCRTILC